MKTHSHIERPTVDWDTQTGYPNELENGSPEHHGAHQRLLELTVEMESDFEPWGKRTRDGDLWMDCSCGCRHFAILDGPLGADWGVCLNQKSPRAGLLTFEHQGCPMFEAAVPGKGILISKEPLTEADIRRAHELLKEHPEWMK
jgi:hypothetical protein